MIASRSGPRTPRPEPTQDPTGQDKRPAVRQRDQGLAHRRERVTERDERFAVAEPVRDIACAQFGEARGRICDSLDGSEDGRRNSEHGKKARQDNVAGFVTEVPQSTR